MNYTEMFPQKKNDRKKGHIVVGVHEITNQQRNRFNGTWNRARVIN